VPIIVLRRSPLQRLEHNLCRLFGNQNDARGVDPSYLEFLHSRSAEHVRPTNPHRKHLVPTCGIHTEIREYVKDGAAPRAMGVHKTSISMYEDVVEDQVPDAEDAESARHKIPLSRDLAGVLFFVKY
jgi:hypothetical protein